jgi:hypothetical protein
MHTLFHASLLLFTFVCIVADPIRPKIVWTGTTTTLANTPDGNLTLTRYVDAKKQLYREDWFSSKSLTVIINDYMNNITYQIQNIEGPVTCEKYPPRRDWSPFRDMFASAKYVGLETVNGKIVDEWSNVQLIEDPTYGFTAYMDVFTGLLVQLADKPNSYNENVTSINVDTPDASIFKVPQEIIDICKQ